LVALDSSPASRKVLAAMPAGARDALVLARLDAVDSLHDDDKADLLEQLVELLDGIGSKKVVARLLAILGSGEVEDIVAPDVAKG
jgi:hypothetical protein